MPIELNLSFPDARHVIVRSGSDDEGSHQLDFTNPITDKDLRDITWYVETYGARSLGDPDDSEAQRIKEQLPVWGAKLFEAVFREREAERRLNSFQDSESAARLLTISTEHPGILVLPWELLHDPAPGGGFLFMENPRISIRRRVAGATGGRGSLNFSAKDTIRLLFVVSRPDDASFLDPRSDSLPVLDAIDAHASGRIICEFLHPPTLDALVARLEDESKPPVDIVHFDGHGVFDRDGGMPKRVAEAYNRRTAPAQELLGEKETEAPEDSDCPPNTGYLLFECKEGHSDFVSANKLGSNLQRHRVGLVILSACQSATVGKQSEDTDADAPTKPAMGSVAARLTATGIPSVLAMTHSVLVATTRTLFGQFYQELARHKSIGEALDNARRHLANHPDKYEVQRHDERRGPYRKKLELHDWFLPALYQPGADVPLLKASPAANALVPIVPKTNLPKAPESGFFGRKHALWEIERWFAGPTRRITLTGFGGQGKTALAQEAGRWLMRTGLFRAAVFLNYANVQSRDAVGTALANIGTVLGESLIDTTVATVALKNTPTLIILDNLETLAPESLTALLNAAVPWSETGGSRVLCTTRRPEFGHADYRVKDTFLHRRISLDGLGSKEAPDDALEWCSMLLKLPPVPTVPAPKREALIELFDMVKFHPLSIRVLAQQLKTRRPAELGERLEELLAISQDAGEDAPASLLASLKLSLDKIDAAGRDMLLRLGVFQGGAFEDNLVAITGLDSTGKRKQIESLLGEIEAGNATELFKVLGAPPNASQLKELVSNLRQVLSELPSVDLWPVLRSQLEAAALIEAEDIPGVAGRFYRFHPTLAPMLWAQLKEEERRQWGTAYRRRYHALSHHLYQEDRRAPHQTRAIAWRELPNLLHAVQTAFDAGDPATDMFADYVNRFLNLFGLTQEAEALIKKAQSNLVQGGSNSWLIVESNRGERLLGAGRTAEAADVFNAIVKQLGDIRTFEKAIALGRLGRSLYIMDQYEAAVKHIEDAIAILETLEQVDQIKQALANRLTDLGNVFLLQGNKESRKAYQRGLEIKQGLNDLRGQGITLGQLGMLELKEGNLAEAKNKSLAARALFQQLREPATEAGMWLQLGKIFEAEKNWDEAELHYREAARIGEETGSISGTAHPAIVWHSIALINKKAGKPVPAEKWLKKAIDGLRSISDNRVAAYLDDLAELLQTQPDRLDEARQLAEESLAINRAFKADDAELLPVYTLLAEIADKQTEACADAHRKSELQTEAGEYRRLALEAGRNAAGATHEV